MKRKVEVFEDEVKSILLDDEEFSFITLIPFFKTHSQRFLSHFYFHLLTRKQSLNSKNFVRLS